MNTFQSNTMSEATANFDPSDPSSPSHYKSNETALLLLDFHNFIVNMADASSAVQVSSSLRQWAIEKQIPVLHCLIDIKEPFSPVFKMAARSAMVSSLPPQMLSETADLNEPSSAFDHHFVRAPGTVSALESRGLMEFLQAKGIRSLVLCGLSTSGCTFSTARAATDKRFVVTIIEDGCSDRSTEVHEVLVKHTLPMTGHVTTSEQFKSNIKY
ncbi:hypothetical protein PROFUN_06633 [Planoprotostelium fungivorum]|uniref:Isochorismatase-like domain-containing protein n=1 Tax=Planoprotostelium fungivorum TaxID=1890364 RepID=A0A2P6MSU0_9EUKA|nr:hypothetical protein PROFUN_06633 [Planoprotostelium fungivorum]